MHRLLAKWARSLSTRAEKPNTRQVASLFRNDVIGGIVTDTLRATDLLSAVLGRPLQITTVQAPLSRVLRGVNSAAASEFEFDARVKFTDVPDQSQAVALVTSGATSHAVLEFQNQEKSYVPARSLFHLVKDADDTLVDIINDTKPKKNKKAVSVDSTPPDGAAAGGAHSGSRSGPSYTKKAVANAGLEVQYAAFEKLPPIHVVTICRYAPVLIDASEYSSLLMSSGKYTSADVSYILKGARSDGKLERTVQALRVIDRPDGKRLAAEMFPFYESSAGERTRKDRNAVIVPICAAPRGVERMSPQQGARNLGTGQNLLNGNCDAMFRSMQATPVTSSYATYLAEHAMWTFVYLPVVDACGKWQQREMGATDPDSDAPSFTTLDPLSQWARLLVTNDMGSIPTVVSTRPALQSAADFARSIGPVAPLRPVLRQLMKELSESHKLIDELIGEKDKAIVEKDKAIVEKDKAIAALQSKLAAANIH